MRANELFGCLPEPVLQTGSAQAALSRTQAVTGDLPAELTNAERAKWVGVERRAVWLEDGHLVVSVDFSRPLGTEVGAQLYLFGYRPDRPFAEMPKLQVRFTQFGYAAQDGLRKLPKSAVQLTRGTKGFMLRVPMEFLGSPRWIMGSVRTYFRKVPLDWIAWRIVEAPF
jgi:hypothetical protein